MGITDDPTDPRLGRGSDETPVPQNEVYLVLSDVERAKGFVRPYRDSYVHVGQKPKYLLRDLDAEEQERYHAYGYIKFEPYPKSDSSAVGRYWTEAQLNREACGALTRMGRVLSE